MAGQSKTAWRLWIWLSMVLGLGYPLFVMGIAQLVWPWQAEGSLLYQGQTIQGSVLIGQHFSNPGYFWPRPSAHGYDGIHSGGSNLGPTSAKLQKAVNERRDHLAAIYGQPTDSLWPADLLYASASGLDPHISIAAAHLQIDRVAKARQIDRQQVVDIVDKYTKKRTLGLFGQPRVHVLLVNKALDGMQEQAL